MEKRCRWNLYPSFPAHLWPPCVALARPASFAFLGGNFPRASFREILNTWRNSRDHSWPARRQSIADHHRHLPSSDLSRIRAVEFQSSLFAFAASEFIGESRIRRLRREKPNRGQARNYSLDYQAFLLNPD